MKKTLIKNGTVVTHLSVSQKDILIEGDRIARIGNDISDPAAEIVNAEGVLIFPGVIDDQVHFREPGLTHKADIRSESRAAVAGGVTSFMEMPNTVPQTLTPELLEEKYAIGSKTSIANYSFYMGVSNDNAEHALNVAENMRHNVCGLKIFMGSSTGNMLVDDTKVLEKIFQNSPMLIATHCEKEEIIRKNLEKAIEKFGVEENIPMFMHPFIRSREACFASSSEAVALAKKYKTRLHVLHISTKEEVELFKSDLTLSEKRITAEACMHHLWFSDFHYDKHGVLIKWNPAIKTESDRDLLLLALRQGHLDVVATDHAPHTSQEKKQGYKSPSGAPLVQHGLEMMYHIARNDNFMTLPQIAEKMSYNPSVCFRIKDRGEIAEGKFADLAILDPSANYRVSKENIYYKCGWSPMEGYYLPGRVVGTFVNGNLVFHQTEEGPKWFDHQMGKRLEFITD